MKKITLISLALFALPIVSLAQGPTLEPLRRLIDSVGTIIVALVPILIGVALIVFFWGMIRYLWKREEEGKKVMVWGLVVLFIMVSVWGIIVLAQSALGVPNVESVPAPRVPLP